MDDEALLYQEVTPTPCGRCGKALAAALEIMDGDPSVRPKDGDLTVCQHCAQLLVFEDGRATVPLDIDVALRGLDEKQIEQLQRLQGSIQMRREGFE